MLAHQKIVPDRELSHNLPLQILVYRVERVNSLSCLRYFRSALLDLEANQTDSTRPSRKWKFDFSMAASHDQREHLQLTPEEQAAKRRAEVSTDLGRATPRRFECRNLCPGSSARGAGSVLRITSASLHQLCHSFARHTTLPPKPRMHRPLRRSPVSLLFYSLPLRSSQHQQRP